MSSVSPPSSSSLPDFHSHPHDHEQPSLESGVEIGNVGVEEAAWSSRETATQEPDQEHQDGSAPTEALTKAQGSGQDAEEEASETVDPASSEPHSPTPTSWLDEEAPFAYLEYTHEGVCKRLYGGSFFNSPLSDDFITINLMKEAPLKCDWYLPIRDFSVPTLDQVEEMEDIFEDLLSSNKPGYVGCYGGIGRTGLFMSCLLRYMGHPDPIAEVRAQYHPHAVETSHQREFVEQFPIKPTVSSPNSSPKFK